MRIGSLLFGAGAGSVATYFLDPDRGRRRRALVRDQLTKLRRRTDEAIEGTRKDLQNRLQGLQAEVRARLGEQGPVSDDVLAERVRAQLGRWVSHPRAIDVQARDGRVTVSGPILALEAAALLVAVRATRGVREVEDRLERHERAGDVPALQGDPSTAMSALAAGASAWSPTARVAVGVGSAFVLLRARRSPGLLAAFVTAVGPAVMSRLQRAQRGGHAGRPAGTAPAGEPSSREPSLPGKTPGQAEGDRATVEQALADPSRVVEG